MTVTGKIEYTGSPRALAKARRGAVKDANKDAVRFWHRRYQPEHFTESATKRYKYRSRTEKYMRRKARIKGHQRPLVWSGRTMLLVASTLRVTGTSKRATGSMSAPALNWKPELRMREELITTVRSERETMAQRHVRQITRQLNGVQTRETKRV